MEAVQVPDILAWRNYFSGTFCLAEHYRQIVAWLGLGFICDHWMVYLKIISSQS